MVNIYMRTYISYTHNHTDRLSTLSLSEERSGISIAKMETDTRSNLSSPFPHVHPIFPPLSLPASGPADVTVLFPNSSPPPTLFQGQTPLHHYTGMDNSDGGV